MKTIAIDIETFSSVDLPKSGVYKYAVAPDFEILLFSYSVDGGKVQTVDLACGEKIPLEILNALEDESIIKSAYNANFERVCLSRYLGYPVGKYLSPYSWHCDMVWAATLGLPLSLEAVGMVLGLEKQKLSEGKALIKYFSTPCKPTKINNGRTRNMPYHAPDKWELYKTYNKRDVETELEIQKKLSMFPVPDELWEEYHIDQEINDRGILVDINFVERAIQADSVSKEKLSVKMRELTKLENPKSVLQMKVWLAENGLKTDKLDKAAVKDLMEKAPPRLAEVLRLRNDIAKTSVKKYTAMQNAICPDNRARGMFQFYGANRSGRFSGRIIQLQNLPQNHLPDLKDARELIKCGDFEMVDMLYGSIPNVLSELIRTAFIPLSNKRFIVADFSAIEARVIAWIAKEEWRMGAFSRGEDIYCASASQMFNVPVVKNGINGHLRQKGKIAELALGYGGSVGALKSMGALKMGLDESELKPLVDVWRCSNPHIVKLWWDIDSAVKKAIKKETSIKLYGLEIFYKNSILFIKLPSGRCLAYRKPRISENQFGGESVSYEGVDNKKWGTIESYGPKFVENIIQGIARDILCHSMKMLRDYSIVAHVHDEIIIEADENISLEYVCEKMAKTPSWAEGLILRADGYECEFYRKD